MKLVGRAVLCAPLWRCGGGRARNDAPYLRLSNVPFEFFQRAPDEPAQPALRQTFRERINRRDAVDVDETFFAAFDDFGFGMIHRARFGFLQFSENKNLVAHCEIIFHER